MEDKNIDETIPTNDSQPETPPSEQPSSTETPPTEQAPLTETPAEQPLTPSDGKNGPDPFEEETENTIPPVIFDKDNQYNYDNR